MRNCKKIVCISNALCKDVMNLLTNEQNVSYLVAHDCSKKNPYVNLPLNISRPLKIGYFGSTYKGKGANFFCSIAQNMEHLEFHLYGGPLINIEKRHFTTKNLTLHGSIPNSEVYAKIVQMDILILPLRYKIEGIGGGNIAKYTSPLKLFEYMAAGKPIIASSLPVLQEVLVNRKNCLIVNDFEVNNWVNAINELSEDLTLMGKIAKNAFEDWSIKYNWDLRAKYIIEFKKNK